MSDPKNEQVQSEEVSKAEETVGEAETNTAKPEAVLDEQSIETDIEEEDIDELIEELDSSEVPPVDEDEIEGDIESNPGEPA